MNVPEKFGGLTIIINEMLPPNTIMFYGGPKKEGETTAEYLKRHGFIKNVGDIAAKLEREAKP